MSGRRVFVLTSVVGLLAAVGGIAAAQTFSDVSPSHPFYEEIEWMADNGISNGYPDGTYRPNTDVTRQAMSAFMQRMAENLLPRASTWYEEVLDDPGWLYADIVAPAPGILIVSGTTVAEGNAFDEGLAVCAITDGVDLWAVSAVGVGGRDTTGEERDLATCAVTTQIPVTAGTHEIYLELWEEGTDTPGAVFAFYNSSISVEWVPHDYMGNAPTEAAIDAATAATVDRSLPID